VIRTLHRVSGAAHGGVVARQGGDPTTLTAASPAATAVMVHERLLEPSSDTSSLMVTALPSTTGSFQSYVDCGRNTCAVSPTVSASSVPESASWSFGIALPTVVAGVSGVSVGELELGAVAGSSTCRLLGPDSSPQPATSRAVATVTDTSERVSGPMAGRLRGTGTRVRARIPRMRARLAALLRVGVPVGVLLASGCGGTSTAPDRAQPEPSQSIPPSLELSGDKPAREPRQALTLVPDSATVLTITDFEAILAGGGASVQLSDGLLPVDDQAFLLQHGFGQGDVDWEARFSGPDGSGYVVAFRPDLDMGLVRNALKTKALRPRALRGATVLEAEHLLVKGTADAGEPVWAMDANLRKLTEAGAESTYLRRGCVPVQVALGDDATYEDQAELVEAADPTYLRPLEAFSVSFGDQVATARLGIDRVDLHERAHLVGLWPETGGGIGLDAGFEGLAVADPSTGRIGLRVVNPVAAATLTLAEMLPFAVCNEVLPFEEPTG